MTWTMPAETDPQERVFMAFPQADLYPSHDTEVARAAWASVAHAVLEFEPVTMFVDPHDREVAATYLSSEIDVVEVPMDDAWLRDNGSTFVFDEQGTRGSVEWVFNGWGECSWSRWEQDREIGWFMTRQTGAVSIPSTLVNEGGGFHVDGQGTVLVTETVQLDPRRNPGLTKADVEAELARTLGASHVVWAPRGLYRDTLTNGTNGHIDMLATIPSPGRLLVNLQNDPAHPDYVITREIRDALAATTDVNGKEWEIVEIPAPQTLRDGTDFVDYNYINHLVVNGGVIACGYDDPHDELAREMLAEAYPGRRVVMVDARPILARGGGVHCITQQLPRARA